MDVISLTCSGGNLRSFIFLNDHMTRPAFSACDFFDKQ